MSLIRVNYVKFELNKLKNTIPKIISTYDSIFKSLDLTTNENTDEAVSSADSQKFAQIQIELLLVKHVALVENMLIAMFCQLTTQLNREDYKAEYFSSESNFSDPLVAINKIAELTEKTIIN